MRAYRLTVADQARREVSQARTWLTQSGSGVRGRARYAALVRAIQDLRTAPTRWPTGDIDGVRERSIEGHRILYRVDETARHVTVLRVFGPFQDRSRP